MRRIAASLCVAAATQTALAAQEPQPDSVVPLTPIEVLVSLLGADGPNVRSGTGGLAVNVDRQHLRAWRAPTPLQALQPASASLYDDLGSPAKLSAVLRGFTVGPIVGMPQGISVFLDGVPMNELGSGDVAFDLLPLEHVERIEVLSGTASLRGPNTLGGAINFITERGGERCGTVEVSLGSNELWDLSARVAGGDVGDWTYYAGGGYESENGWRSRMGSDRTHLFVTMGNDGVASGVRFQLTGARSYAQTAGSLPASVYATRPDSNLTAGDFELLRQLQLSVTGYRNVAGGVGSARGFVRASDAERFNVNQAADPDIRGLSDARTAGVELDWRKALDVGTTQVALRTGGGGTFNRTGIELFAERIDPGQTTRVRSPVTRFDLYGVADWRLGALTVSPGVRLDVVRVPFRNLLDPARDTTSTYVQLAPRGTLSWQVTTPLGVHVSVGRGFRAPSLIEIACADPEEPCPLPFALGDDPPIDPVRVLTYEAGIRYMRPSLSVQGAVYRSDVHDDIFLFPYSDATEPTGSTIDGYFGNVPRTRRTGGELNLQLQLSPRTRTYANYALTRATFESDDIEIFSIREVAGAENEVEEGDRFPLVPSFTLSLGVDTEVAGFELGAAANVVGSRFLRGDEANDEDPLPAHETVDLRAGYVMGSWRLEALVRNVTDERHSSFGGFNVHQGAGDTLERFLTPGAPRRLQFGVERSF